MSEFAICPHCGRQMDTRGICRHISACSRRPDDDTLREWCTTGVQQREMADRCRVAQSTVATWMAELGLSAKQPKSNCGRRRWSWTGPLYGRNGACDETCAGYAVCSTRRRGWPVLCERLPAYAVQCNEREYGWTPDSYEGVMR